MKINQKGFAVIEGLLIAILIVLIGGVGYFVYANNKNENQAQTTNPPQQKAYEESNEGVAEWQTIESGKKAFKMQVPDGWKLTSSPSEDKILSSLDSKDLIYRKGQKAEIIVDEVPGSDAPHRLFITVLTALDQIAPSPDAEKTSFTLNSGIKGERVYYLHTKDQEGLGSVKGEKSYTYTFEKNTKYYYVSYRILPGDVDNLAIVEKAIKTLQF